jgi:hypothetical protein
MRSVCAIGIIVGFGCVASAQSAAEKTALDQCLAAAPGSESDGVARAFYVPQMSSDREAGEFINAIRTSAEVVWISRCKGVNGIAVRGTTDQLGATDWLIHQVFGSESTNNSSPQYVMANRPGPVIRIFHLQRAANQQGQQQMTNLLRTETELQRIAQLYRGMSVIVRGEAARVTLAEWLVNELDRAPQSFARQTVAEDPWEPTGVVRIFPLPQVQTQQAAWDIVNLVRSMSELQRVSPYDGGGMNTIVARGEADAIALADWLIGQLQTPNGDASRAFGNKGESVKLFYRPASSDPQELARLAKAIADAVPVKRLGFYAPSRAIVMRGTPDQVAKAQKAIGMEP